MSGQIPLEMGRELRVRSENGAADCVIEQVIGCGGSCVVYLGRDQRGGFRRVIKEFYPHPRALPGLTRQGDELVVPESCRAAFREREEAFAKGISRYCAYYEDHDVYANPRPFLYGRANGTTYAVSDPAQGQVLSEVNRDSLTLCRTAQILCSLCGAIQRFHAQGLLYLDCKPENIFLYQVDRRDHVRLFDFDTVASREDLLAGAPLSCSAGWAPEEQTHGRIDELGEEADIYAVGAVFFFLLTGDRPGTQQLREIGRDRFRWRTWAPLLENAPDRVLETVRRIAGHTLRSQPEDRYADIVQLKRDFQELAGLTEDDGVIYRPIYEEMAGFTREMAAMRQTMEVLRRGSLTTATLDSIASPELRSALRTELETLRDLEDSSEKEKLERQRERIEELRKNMLKNWELVAEYCQGGGRDVRDAREKRALEAAARGRYTQANSILRDPGWREDIRSMSAVLEEARGRCRQYISGQKLLISNLRAMGVGDAAREEVSGIYREITGLAEEYQVEYGTLYDWADFLCSQHEYNPGIEIALRLRKIYALHPPKDEVDKARLDILLGRMHYNLHSYKDARDYYGQAAEIFQGMPGEHLEEQAWLYNRIADYAWRQHHAKEAEESLEKVLSLLDTLPESDENLRARAHAYGRLATLANRRWSLDQAEDYHREAWRIWEDMLRKDPSNDDLLQEVGMVCSNLGIVCRRKCHYADSEEVFLRSYRIRKKGYGRNRRLFALGYGIVCSNYAFMLAHAGRLEEAEAMIRRAVPVKKELMDGLHDAYEASYGITLNNYGFILTCHDDPEHLARAEELFREALLHLEQAAKRDPYSNALPECRDNYMLLLEKLGRPEEAEVQVRLALETWFRLSREDPTYYIHEIALDSARLGRLLGDTPEARDAYRQALRYGKAVMEKAASYHRKDYEQAIREFLALLEGDPDCRDEVRELEEELRACQKGGTADERED